MKYIVRKLLWISLILSIILSNSIQSENVKKETIDYVFDLLKEKFIKVPVKEIIHKNDKASKDKLSFLNVDFQTEAFDRALKCDFIDAFFKSDIGDAHIGIIVIQFNSIDDINLAMKKVLLSKRNNFMLKVLTKFVCITNEKTMLFLYSETPISKSVQSIFSFGVNCLWNNKE